MRSIVMLLHNAVILLHVAAAEEDRGKIERMSRQSTIVSRIARSIAPSIYGNDNVKMVSCCHCP